MARTRMVLSTTSSVSPEIPVEALAQCLDKALPE